MNPYKTKFLERVWSAESNKLLLINAAAGIVSTDPLSKEEQQALLRQQNSGKS